MDMPLWHWQSVTVQKYPLWNCHRNTFCEFTLIYGTQDVSWTIRNVLRAVERFSGVPECQLTPTKLQRRSSGWRILSWTASVHSRYCHESLSPAALWHPLYEPSSRSWLRSQHRIGSSGLTLGCWWSSSPQRKPCIRLQFSSVQVVWQIYLWDWLPWFQLPETAVAHDVGIIYLQACISLASLERFRTPHALFPSDDQHLSKWLLLVGLYSGAPEIGNDLLWNPFQPHSQGPPLQHESYESFVRVPERDSIAHRLSNLAFRDFDIWCSQKIPFFWWHCLCALPSALRDRSQWFCWLTSRESSHNARTAPSTISSEAAYTAVFQSSLEQTVMWAQFTDSVLIIPWISFPH